MFPFSGASRNPLMTLEHDRNSLINRTSNKPSNAWALTGILKPEYMVFSIVRARGTVS